MSRSLLRSLPAVSDVLALPATTDLTRTHGHAQTVEAVRIAIADLRKLLLEGKSLDGAVAAESVAAAAATHLAKACRPSLRPVINATGIVLHTNLGRAPMAESAAKAAYDAARGYQNLELDLESGDRSHRSLIVRSGICRVTAAESATAVNNCAAATVLVLRALAAGREVIVSRGQLVEIGGSFRVPEIMAVSGAILREVGTTNITRIADYERAIGPSTALLMRIHQSNYRIQGFTATPSIEEIAALGKKTGLSVVDDIGSGALVDLGRFGLSGEPLARASLAAGADLVLFSGDKLMGGPQAGIIAGRTSLIERIERDPLMRAFRLDKMTLAALEATLRLYLDEERALESVPVLRMLGLSVEQIRARAQAIASRLMTVPGLSCIVRDEVGYVGGGSLPDQSMPTSVIALRSEFRSEMEFAHRLRIGAPSVVARIQAGELLFDLRTVFAEQESALVAAIIAAVADN